MTKGTLTDAFLLAEVILRLDDDYDAYHAIDGLSCCAGLSHCHVSCCQKNVLVRHRKNLACCIS